MRASNDFKSLGFPQLTHLAWAAAYLEVGRAACSKVAHRATEWQVARMGNYTRKYLIVRYAHEHRVVQVLMGCDDLERYAKKVLEIETGYIIPANALAGAKKGHPFVAHDGAGWKWMFPLGACSA